MSLGCEATREIPFREVTPGSITPCGACGADWIDGSSVDDYRRGVLLLLHGAPDLHAAESITGGDADADDDDYSNIHRAANRGARKVRDSFLAAVRSLAAEIDVQALVEGMLSRGEDGALDAIGPVAEFFEPIAAELEDVFADAGERAAVETERQIRDSALRASREVGEDEAVSISFDRGNPRAVQAAKRVGATLIQEVEETFKAAIRLQVARGFEEGVPLRELARRIIDEGLGLTTQQLGTVEKFRAGLVEKGVTGAKLDRRVGRYYDAQLKRRARTIARQETLTAANAGTQEVWLQARDARLLPAEVKREPVLTDDDRLCAHVCEPMFEQQVGLKEPFTTGDGRLMMNPSFHVGCRCGQRLVLP